ncbi:hypothetical protein [Micromonospora sp. NPDC050200]|uniref:hypothetical protein n=1 Tax=Micromonospora sp. NPDC050200 TaxID=3155664 RepID=UPI003410C733
MSGHVAVQSLLLAPLRGFGVKVKKGIGPRVPLVHLKTCGSWGCHERDVPLHVFGPTSAMPCPSGSATPDAAGVAHLLGPGPVYGYAPVPELTLEQVTGGSAKTWTLMPWHLCFPWTALTKSGSRTPPQPFVTMTVVSSSSQGDRVAVNEAD